MTTALLVTALVLACLLLVDLAQSALRRRRPYRGSLAELRASFDRAARQEADWT